MGGFRFLLRLGLLAMVLMVQCQAAKPNVLTEELAFEHHEQLREVKCGMKGDANTAVNVITLQKMGHESALIILKNIHDDNGCTTSTSFAACTSTKTEKQVRLIVADLAEGETRRYNCTITGYHDVTVFREEVHINVTRPVSTTPSERATGKNAQSGKEDEGTSSPQPPSDTSSASGVGVGWVVVLVLIVLVLAVVCGVLGFRFYRDSRKRESCSPNVDLDTVSFKSGVTDKDFALMTSSRRTGGGGKAVGAYVINGGMGMGAVPMVHANQYGTPGSPPPAADAPGVPGMRQPFVMQYQTPGDAGYMSDACQYQQPWGQPLRDPEILSHMSTLQRPNRRVVKIPNFEAASASPPPDRPPPPVYQDGPASLNDAE